MSVMLEHQVTPQSPCTPDCPDRSGDCMLHCPHGYAEYRAARAAAAETSRIASAGKRQASVKKARMAHRHKR